jgi:hypothetical protein
LPQAELESAARDGVGGQREDPDSRQQQGETADRRDARAQEPRPRQSAVDARGERRGLGELQAVEDGREPRGVPPG